MDLAELVELVHYYLKNNTVYTTYLKSKKVLIKLKQMYKENLFFKKMDLGSDKDITNFLKIIQRHSNSVDIIVLNALNNVKRKKFIIIKKREIIKSLSKNFLGNFFLLQMLSKKILIKNKVRVLHISSIVSKKGSWGLSAYGPVKAAVDNLFKCLQYEFKNKIKFKSIYLSQLIQKDIGILMDLRKCIRLLKQKKLFLKLFEPKSVTSKFNYCYFNFLSLNK